MKLDDFIRNTHEETLIRVYKIGRSLNSPIREATLPQEHIALMSNGLRNRNVCLWGIERLKPKTNSTPVLWVLVE